MVLHNTPEHSKPVKITGYKDQSLVNSIQHQYKLRHAIEKKLCPKCNMKKIIW
jgi:hypothetical protein